MNLLSQSPSGAFRMSYGFAALAVAAALVSMTLFITDPAAAQEQQQQQETPNQAPTVSSAIGDATIVNESGTRQVSLTGVFDDADNDSLTITAASSDVTKATVSVAADYSSLTVTAQARGTATITVTADDGNGGTVDDTFTVRVKAAPVAALNLLGRIAVGSYRSLSLVGVFSDADGDALSITASSDDETVATVTTATDGSSLAVTGVSAGKATITVTAQDTDGNRVSKDIGVGVSLEPPPPPIIDQVLAVHEGYYIYWSQYRSWSMSGAERGNYRIVEYEIAWKKQTDTEWESGNMPGFTLKSLRRLEENNKYHIRIRGTNIYGNKSDWSEVYDAPKVESHPNIPDPPGVLWLVPYEDSILVKILPALHKGGRTITHYILRYTDDGGATFSDRILTPDETPDYKITGLRPGTEYGVVVRTAYSGGSSKDSHLFVTETLPPDNNLPTVSSAIGDAIIVNESGTHQVSLSGVFDDADNDNLTITASSSDDAKATVSVAPDGSSLTVTAKARGTATITVTADDGNGGAVDDTFTVTVKAAPVVSSGLTDVSGLEAGATQDVSLSGVFSDADGDSLTITASSSDDAKATVTVASDNSKLTLSGSCRRNGDHHRNGTGLRWQPGQRRLRCAGGEEVCCADRADV